MERASTNRMQTALDKMTRNGGPVPGLSAALVRHDRTVWTGASGVANIGAAKAAAPQTVYLWFSMTKIVTATAVMQLAERGRLGLDDPVTDYVRDFPSRGTAPVKIRHLLSHSSGLGNPILVRWVRPATSDRPDPREFMAGLLARHKKLKGYPGQTARYSNLGYLVLGEIVAAATGVTYTDYVKSRILTPLGMRSTDFVYRSDFATDAATGYQLRWHPMALLLRLMLPRGIVGHTEGRFLSFRRFIVDGPAYGGLIGTVEDAARFLALHTSPNEIAGGSVLTAASTTLMQEIQATGPALDVGLGWFRYRSATTADLLYLEHLGGGGAFFNMMRIFPRERCGVIVMGNSSSFDHKSIAAAAVDSLSI